MHLTLQRFEFTEQSTISNLFVDGVPFCFALEDCDRELETYPERKEYGKTAVPRGRYKIILDYSNRFRRVLPRLLDVPGYVGVRIHPGNAPEDTEGCILPGSTWKKDWVSNSRTTFNQLFAQMEEADECGQEIEISIL